MEAMPFRETTEITRGIKRPPWEKALMTKEQLDKFLQGYLYERKVRRMSVEEDPVRNQPEVRTEVPEPTVVVSMVAKQPTAPPPAHLLLTKTPQIKGSYYTRIDS